MSLDETSSTTTPQYIVTTPGDGDDGGDTTTTTILEQSSPNSIINTSTSISNNKIVTKTISLSTRSQSLQSSTSSASIVDHTSAVNALMEQLKAQSSANIGNISEKHFKTIVSTSTSSSSSSSAAAATSSKGKFQSFLQNPDTASGSVTHTTSTGTFLTAQQKHVRQFVRSSSAHSTDSGAAAITNKADKTCIRSASTQIDGTAASVTNEQGILSAIEQHQSVMASKGLQQSSTILISKSAETIEAKTSTSGIRTQLTLSGGFLAPPNRKLTILSPVHAPPGLHDMLKRHGRSPLSPRISFPGGDTDLFHLVVTQSMSFVVVL